jgi:hypothetical protein
MTTEARPPQSTFVTVLAWILVVFGAFGVLSALMQNVMINFMVPQMIAAQQKSGLTSPAFPVTGFRVVGVAFLVVASFIAYSAYALLKRRNWARRIFVVLFCLGIIANCLFALGFGVGFQFAHFPTSGQQAMPPGMGAAFRVMTIMMAIFAAAIAALFVWLVRRLRSPLVKAEFTDSRAVTAPLSPSP